MSRPGMMIYFEYRDALRLLSVEQRCCLYDAMLDFGMTGEVPVFEDLVCAALWKMIQPRLELDAQVYETKVEKSRKAAKRRWQGEESGNAKDCGGTEASADACQHNPTTATTTATTTTPTATATTAATATATPTATTSSVQHRRSPAQQPGIRAAQLPTDDKFIPPRVEDVLAYSRSRGYPLNAEKFVSYYAANGWRLGKNPMRDWRAAVDHWNQTQKERENHGKTGLYPNFANEITKLGPIGDRV